MLSDDVAKQSNSPFRTPSRNARHSSGRNLSTGPLTSLLSRIPTWPPGRSATSTQFPFAWLNELLVQGEAVADLIVSPVRRKSYILTPQNWMGMFGCGAHPDHAGGWKSLRAESHHGDLRQ